MCPDDRGWNDDDRLSWRERDKLKDRSRHRTDEKPEGSGGRKQQAQMKTFALQQAKKLFTPKKNPQQLQAEEALEAVKGQPAFDPLAQAYFDTYGVTQDWHVQLLLTGAGISSIAVPAIEALALSAAGLGPAEKRAISSQLKILAMTGKSKTKIAAREALNKIG